MYIRLSLALAAAMWLLGPAPASAQVFGLGSTHPALTSEAAAPPADAAQGGPAAPTNFLSDYADPEASRAAYDRLVVRLKAEAWGAAFRRFDLEKSSSVQNEGMMILGPARMKGILWWRKLFVPVQVHYTRQGFGHGEYYKVIEVSVSEREAQLLRRFL